MKTFFPAVFFLLSCFGLNAQDSLVPPVLLAPANLAINQSPNVTFKWQHVYNVEDDLFYFLYFDSDTMFSHHRVFGIRSTFSDTIQLQYFPTDPPFQFGEKYYWKMCTGKFGVMSEFSDIWSFTTFDQLELNEPENGSTNIPFNVALKWNPSVGGYPYSGVDYFRVQSDTSSTFTSPVFFEDTILFGEFQTAKYTLSPGQTYYWRVRAVNSVDDSKWSEVWHFTTAFNQGIQNGALPGIDRFRICPNPVIHDAELRFNAAKSLILTISLYDIHGALIHTIQDYHCFPGDNNIRIPFGSYAEGIYVINLKTGKYSQQIQVMKSSITR